MRILYLSPSVFPSRSANSIHVIRMCEAFLKFGHQVTLIGINDGIPNHKIKSTIETYYSVDLTGAKFSLLKRAMPFGLNLQLGFFSLINYLIWLCKNETFDIVISRNLYASFLIGRIFAVNMFFETHQIEAGWRKWIQKEIVRFRGVKTIVISSALKKLLRQELSTKKFSPLVLHDAAPQGIEVLDSGIKKRFREQYLTDTGYENFKKLVGYFGHLYTGRGVEVILKLSKIHPEHLFLVFGGNEEQIADLRLKHSRGNLMFMGYIQPGVVIQMMGIMDVLLMPYQQKVYIGDRRSETARWMSPMKMFEYMAVGVPVIASDLPVLNEVLSHEKNCMLAGPENIDDWSGCLNRLTWDTELAKTIAANAHQDYLNTYNWHQRASQVIENKNHA